MNPKGRLLLAAELVAILAIGRGCSDSGEVASSALLDCDSVDPDFPKKRLICHCQPQSQCVFLSIASKACEAGHSGHAKDFDATSPADCSAFCAGKDDATACDDGNACTNGDACQNGRCVAGAAVACSAADQCHGAGTCDPTTGNCSSPPVANGTLCDDGNACSSPDTCQNGVCTSAPCQQTEFSWEVSLDDGATWSPVTLPDTEFGCSYCTRYYRTFYAGQPSDVSFRFGSDNEARMFVNGNVVFDEYFVNGVDFCTTASCCSECCDTFANCTNVVNGQAPFSLDGGDLAAFGAGTNEIRWQVNQQSGGSGFHTLMTITQ